MRNSHMASLQPGHVAVDVRNAGAVIYGPYGLSVNGEIQSFVHWLNSSCHPYGKILSTWSAGSREFSAAWIFLGENDPEGFMQLQETFRYFAEICAS